MRPGTPMPTARAIVTLPDRPVRGPSRVLRPHPPTVLRVELERARAAGVPFSVAWDAAVPVVLRDVPANHWHRGQWAMAFEATRGAWQRAYTGVPAAPGERVMAGVP